MILNCNSCGKKFVVPDNAVPTSGRLVQCGSCGNKWKQFPVSVIKSSEKISNTQKSVSKRRPIQEKIQNKQKTQKRAKRKPREINLYSPEYLAKKHGINLSENVEKKSSKKKVSFGF